MHLKLHSESQFHRGVILRASGADGVSCVANGVSCVADGVSFVADGVSWVFKECHDTP